MIMSKKVLLAGESWMSYTTHVKGFDAFYTSTYETGEKWLKAALEAGGYEVTSVSYTHLTIRRSAPSVWVLICWHWLLLNSW